MHRTCFVLLVALAAIGSSGCDWQLGPEDGPHIGIGIATSPDLMVQVYDDHLRQPVQNATVTIIHPNITDSGVTNPGGWTDWLLVPSEAEGIQVSVQFWDERWNPQTVYRWVHLERGETRRTIYVSTRTP